MGGAIGGIVGSVAGGLFASSGAKKAANAQTAAANANIAFQKESRDLIRDDISPYLNTGNYANAALNYEIFGGEVPVFGATAPEVETFQELNPAYTAGHAAQNSWTGSSNALAPQNRNIADLISASSPVDQYLTKYRVGDTVFDSQAEAQLYADANKTGGTEYGGYKASAAYQNRLLEGLNNIDARDAARGSFYSGASKKAAIDYQTQLLDADYGDHLNRLFTLAGSGQNAAALQATNISNSANQIGNSFNNIGNAQAAGAIGQANAINGTFNNLTSLFAGQQANSSTNQLFGGNSWG